jgi:hypothetical protein
MIFDFTLAHDRRHIGWANGYMDQNEIRPTALNASLIKNHAIMRMGEWMYSSTH